MLNYSKSDDLKIGQPYNKSNSFTSEEIIELMGNAWYEKAECLALSKNQMPELFFDLSSKIAGSILQKFSTYDMKLIIHGDFQNLRSTSLKDFINESNKTGNIIFSETLIDGIALLKRKL